MAGCAPVETVSVDRFGRTGELVALSGGGAGASYACFTCHGLRGQGDGGSVPRLAGIPAGYLERQLIAFGDGRRVDRQMSYVAANLDPRERKAVAAYYAAMPSPAPDPARSQSLTAARLYRMGDPARGLPACASCHGPRGAGLGRAYPPLSAHPPGYLAGQLKQWRRAERRNDPGGVMLRISQLLTPTEGAALAAYAATLPGGPPSPESPAAFLAARPGDPRNDASGPPLHVPESARAAPQ